MSKKPSRGLLSAASRVCKQIIEDEKNTPEGKTNTFFMFLAVLGFIATPLFSGATLKVEERGSEGWSFQLEMGDVLGAFIALICGGSICVVIVAGTNYLRRREGVSPDFHRD